MLPMKNFVLISPNFPETYYQFAVALRNVGFRVLGVGDQPYNELRPELRNALHEYYKVNVMDDFDQEKEAVGYFERKYGHIDFTPFLITILRIELFSVSHGTVSFPEAISPVPNIVNTPSPLIVQYRLAPQEPLEE